MKNFGMLRARAVAVKTALVTLAMVSAAAANATLPPWATDIGEDLSTAVNDSAALVGPVVALSIVAVVVIKLIKRFSNKI